MFPDGGAAEQNRKAHVLPVGQTDFYRPDADADTKPGPDHDPLLADPEGILDRTYIDNRGHALRSISLACVIRHNFESCPALTVPVEQLDFPGMERRGPGAGIDLRPDRLNSKIGQPDPFAPADYQAPVATQGEAGFGFSLLRSSATPGFL